jgi:hypothetical protein
VQTRDAVEKLKKNWLSDPCWDIEDTEGFEHFRTELFNFRLDHEAQWEAQNKAAIHDRSIQLGIPEKPLLTAYLMKLENQVAAMWDLIDKLRTECHDANLAAPHR